MTSKKESMTKEEEKIDCQLSRLSRDMIKQLTLTFSPDNINTLRLFLSSRFSTYIRKTFFFHFAKWKSIKTAVETKLCWHQLTKWGELSEWEREKLRNLLFASERGMNLWRLIWEIFIAHILTYHGMTTKIEMSVSMTRKILLKPTSKKQYSSWVIKFSCSTSAQLL